MYQEPLKPIFFLKLPEVLKRTAMGKSKLYEKIGNKEFPPPVKDGKSVAWPEHEVLRWQTEMMKARSVKA